eukprot:gene16950-23226_t
MARSCILVHEISMETEDVGAGFQLCCLAAEFNARRNAFAFGDRRTMGGVKSNRNLRSRAIYDCTNPAVPFYPIYLAPAIGARPGGTHADISFSARAFRPPQPPLLAFLAGLVLLGACQAQSSLILSYIDFDTFASVKVSDSFMGISSNYETLPTYVGNTTFQQLMKNALAFGNKGSIVFRHFSAKYLLQATTEGCEELSASIFYYMHFSAKYLLQLPLK